MLIIGVKFCLFKRGKLLVRQLEDELLHHQYLAFYIFGVVTTAYHRLLHFYRVGNWPQARGRWRIKVRMVCNIYTVIFFLTATFKADFMFLMILVELHIHYMALHHILSVRVVCIKSELLLGDLIKALALQRLDHI